MNTFSQTENCFYVPDHCQKENDCITVLSSNYNETTFVISHIQELNLRIKVLWLGHKLPYVINYLVHRLENQTRNRKKFIILHWKPSELIDIDEIEYSEILMRPCEQMQANVPCMYELTPILKYVSPKLWHSMDPVFGKLNQAVSYEDLKYIFATSNRLTRAFSLDGLSIDGGGINTRTILSANDRFFSNENSTINLYNKVACDWYKLENSSIFNVSDSNKDKIEVTIGLLFPKATTYTGLEVAVAMAKEAIIESNILENINFTVMINNGECKSDAVMKNFVNLYTQSDVMGVLGPACSETVEPIAGE